jgi:hypothetical protein
MTFGVRLEHEIGLGHRDPSLIPREAKAVGADEIVNHNVEGAVGGVEPIDLTGAFLIRLVALIVDHDSLVRIGEPNGAVRLQDDISRDLSCWIKHLRDAGACAKL